MSLVEIMPARLQGEAIRLDRELAAEIGHQQKAGEECIEVNYRQFVAILHEADSLLRQGRLAMAAATAQMAVASAHEWHPGIFASALLERQLASLGAQLGVAQSRFAPQRGGRGELPCRILHVATYVAPVGGHTRLIQRWMTLDSSRQHSLALTHQFAPVPADLSGVVTESGGKVLLLNRSPGGLLHSARRLSRLGESYDLVVIHSHNFDLISLVAFAGRRERPVILVDHIDHQFWPGGTVADLVVSLRHSGMELCRERRGIVPQRNVLVPTPVPQPVRAITRGSARARLGLAQDAVILVSVARAVKYVNYGSLSYAASHVPILREHPQAVLVTVGPKPSPEWVASSHAADGRLRRYDEVADPSIFYAAADIYVDSFPFVSNTSLAEAGLHGLPLVSRCPYPGPPTVLGADLPGFVDHLRVASSFQAYLSCLDRLIRDRSHRESLGRRTREAIMARHSGVAARTAIEEAYRLAVDQPIGAGAGRELTDTPTSGRVPDVFLPFVFGSAHLDLGEADRRSLLCELSLKSYPWWPRTQAFARLERQRAFRLRTSLERYKYLLPEWLGARARATITRATIP